MLLGLLGKRGGDSILRNDETVRANLLDRLLEDFLDGRSGVDELYAVWLLGSNGAKSLVNALLEGYAFCSMRSAAPRAAMRSAACSGVMW